MDRRHYIRMAERSGTNDFHRDVTVSAIRAKEGEERRIILSFSSEEPYDRAFGPEILDHSEGAANLSRLNEIGCLLYNHNRDRVIGKVIRAWIKEGRGEAEVEFDEDAESDIIYQKVLSGSLKGVSVGYMVDWDAAEEVKTGKKSRDGRFEGPCCIMRKWEPYEISIVSIPADSTVGVGRELGQAPAAAPLSVFERQLQINKNIGGTQV